MTDTKDLHRQLNAAIRREFDARQAGAVSAQQMAMDEIRRLRRLIIRPSRPSFGPTENPGRGMKNRKTYLFGTAGVAYESQN